MENINYYLEKIHLMTNVSCICYNTEQKKMLCTFGEVIKRNSPIFGLLEEKEENFNIPKIYFKDDKCFGVYKDSTENMMIFGPVQHTKLYLLNSLLSIVYTQETGNMIHESEIILQKLDEKDNTYKGMQLITIELLDELDYFNEHNIRRSNYEDELHFMKTIENGDIDKLLNHYKEDSFINRDVGVLAINSLKQLEYIASTVITLATRAAISGGLDVMTAYNLSDYLFRRLESSRTEEEISELITQTNIEFTRKVAENKNKKSNNYYVEECKNYITRHKNKKITINDICENIGLSKTHLSKLFLQEEGVTIHQYIIEMRLDMGANLLKFSNESITTIAEYLCFNSQSHFGKVFKDKFGITPQKYRNEHKIIDFI